MAKTEVKDTMTLEELEKNIQTLIPDLVTAAEKPAVYNPFISNLKMNTSDKVQMALLCFLIPIRMTLLLLSFIFGGLIAKLFLIGFKESSPPVPMTGFRRFGQQIMWFFARCCAHACGFHHITVKGKLAGPEEAPVVVCAPHSTFIDGLAFGRTLGLVSAVSRIENLSAFLIGSCVRIIQPVAVSRADRDSKTKVVKEIKRRAKEGNWPPIIIFPEGTCTNRKCFITFKPGAFYPGVPVQPLLVKFKDKLDYATWSWIGLGVLPLLCIMMSRIKNNMEIEILPVYKPSEEEKEDAFLYARNVRDYMASVGGVPVTDHSYEDCRLMTEAKKLGLPMQAGLVEYYKLSPMIGMNCDCMIEYFRKFAKIDQNCDGVISLEEFCDYLNLPPTEEIKTIFRIYDIDKDSSITFREYLLGCFLISTPFNTDSNISMAFKLFDSSCNDYITIESFSELLTTVMNLHEAYIRRMYEELDSENTGKVNIDNFRDFCLQKPEYALLFIHFRNLQSRSSSMTFSPTHLRSGSVTDFQYPEHVSV